MSKSYGRCKTIGICYGNNTDWYRDRRKSFRRKNKHIIKNLLANKLTEDFDDFYLDYRMPRKDDWDEPTDGSWKLYAKELNYRKFKGIYKNKHNKIKK